MKLRRVYETAEDGKSVEEVALERYGSRGAFEEAHEERRILDESGDKARPQKANRRNTLSVTKVDLQVKTPSDVQARVDRRRHPPLRIHSLNPTLQLIDASTHYVLHQMRHPQAPNRKLLPRALQLL